MDLQFPYLALPFKGHGQPKVTIRTIFVVLDYPMLFTTFQGHRSTGSGEDFYKFFTIYGHGNHLGSVIQTMSINFYLFLFSHKLSYESLSDQI